MKIEIKCKSCGELLQNMEILPEDCVKFKDGNMKIEFDAWHCCDTKVLISEGVMG